MTPEEVELLSELTIIIPTYNRPLELERSIEYWRDTPVTVHILDGSEKPWFPVGAIPGTNNISYNHVPQDIGEDWFGNYSRRIVLATELVKTTYVALCSDDDFFTTSGLLDAIYALNSDKADVVIGKCAQYLFREGIFEWSRINWDWRCDKLSLSSDIWDHFASNSKGSTYYGIYKKTDWVKIRLSSVDFRFLHVGATENLSNYLTKCVLRVLVLDTYLWVTNYPDKRYPNMNIRNGLQKFSKWLNDSGNAQEVEIFLSALESGFQKFLPNEKHHLSKFMARTILMNRGIQTKVYNARSLRINMGKVMLRFMSTLPLMIRKVVFSLLTQDWKKVLRTPDFVDSRTPVMKLDSQDNELIKAMQNWEKILLMPREELRLRANI